MPVLQEESMPRSPILRSSFASDMVGSSRDEARLVNFIKYIHSVKHSEALYSTMITLCQSSGYGKSKLACEMSKYFPLAYIVFRSEEDNIISYPQISDLTFLFLSCFDLQSDQVTIMKRHILLIQNILQKLLFINQREGRSFPEIKQMCVDGTFELEFKASDADVMDIIDLENGIKETLKSFPSGGRLPVILVFDEILFLRNTKITYDQFRIIRRTFNHLRYCGLVFLVLGTSSDFLDLNPTIGSNSSRDTTNINSTPPFILSSNFDIFSNKINEITNISKAMLCNEGILYSLISLGRPLWSSISLDRVFPLAKEKLTNNSIQSGQALAACWMIRTGIVANPFFTVLSRYLVKSLMGTLLNVSEDLLNFIVHYPSEPVLAIAARNIVAENTVQYFKEFFKFLQYQSFEVGRVSENLAIEIILQAISKAEQVPIEEYDQNLLPIKKPNGFILENNVNPAFLERFIPAEELYEALYLKVCTVKNFLISLYGADFVLKLSIDPMILGAYVNTTHFTNIQDGVKGGIIDEPLLRMGLLRQCGFVMPAGYYGIDFVIPICLDSGPSYIGVQVKTSQSDFVKCLKKMDVSLHYDGTFNKNSLVLVMNMSSRRSGVVNVGACDAEERVNEFGSLSVKIFKYQNTSTGLKFAEVKKTDGCTIYGIRSSNFVLFEHIWGDNKRSINKTLKSIIRMSHGPANAFPQNGTFAPFISNQIEESYLANPSYVNKNNLLQNWRNQ